MIKEFQPISRTHSENLAKIEFARFVVSIMEVSIDPRNNINPFNQINKILRDGGYVRVSK